MQVQRKGTEAPVIQERIEKLKKAIDVNTLNPEALAKKIGNF